MLKKTLLAITIVVLSGNTMAEMSAMGDNELSAVTGKDGVSIIADLNLTIDPIVFTVPDDIVEVSPRGHRRGHAYGHGHQLNWLARLNRFSRR